LETIAFVCWLPLCRQQRGKPLLSKKQHSICLICDPSRLNVFILLPLSIRKGNSPPLRTLPQQQHGIILAMTSLKFFAGGGFSFRAIRYWTIICRVFLEIIKIEEKTLRLFSPSPFQNPNYNPSHIRLLCRESLFLNFLFRFYI
jgi:hypothetical protein